MTPMATTLAIFTCTGPVLRLYEGRRNIGRRNPDLAFSRSNHRGDHLRMHCRLSLSSIQIGSLKMIDVFILDAVYSLLDADLDCLDDAAFGEAITSQAAYLSGIMYD